MDWIRTIIIAAIIAVGLMLANAWVGFKQQQTAATTPAAPAATETPDERSADVPSAAEHAASTTPGGHESQVPEPAQQDAAAQSGIVTVSTDVLTIRIALHGGDIVRAELPKYLDTLDSRQPFVLLEQDRRRTYIAQSGLIGDNGTDNAAGRPTFSTAKQHYELAPGNDTLTVNLSYTQPSGAKIDKRFVFHRGSYLVDLTYHIDNTTGAPWKGSLYAQLKRDNSPDPSQRESAGTNIRSFLGVATRTNDKPYVKISFKNLPDEPFNQNVHGGWIAMVQHYFLSAWIPPADGTYSYSTKVTGGNGKDHDFNLIRFITPAITVAPGKSAHLSAELYTGPKDQYRLRAIAPGLDLTVDYGWLWWIAQPLFWILTHIHKVVGNWGWSIILLTVFVKLAFFKLSASSYRSMAKMRKVTPKMQQIRERHAGDRQKQSQAMMELYRKEKVNPLGGCLPIVIQMPVFIALYWVLMESVELRHAPWILWVHDLSSRDPYFILPLIMGAAMWFQQRLNPPPPDPTQAKIMQIMPIAFTFFFLWFPAGLVLYWVVNNILSITQQWVITRQIEKES